MLPAINYITEADLQATVREYAERCGWRVFCTWNSKHSPEGEPDLRMVRPPRYILAELKRENGKSTNTQAEVLELLRCCPGVESYLWQPSDWDDLVKVLQ